VPSFRHSEPLVQQALALLEPALAAAAEVERVLLSYRTLLRLESKQRELLPTIQQFSFPS
jgi:hypothetical protein